VVGVSGVFSGRCFGVSKGFPISNGVSMFIRCFSGRFSSVHRCFGGRCFSVHKVFQWLVVSV